MAGGWSFLTNHARVLLCIARDPGTRIRDIAVCAEITERAAHRIVSDLCEAGYVEKHRLGARNYYEVHAELPLRRELESGVPVGELLAPLLRRLRQEQRSVAPPADGDATDDGESEPAAA
jgi:DNA-binding IclR family transcriptional regulator